jgi:hypothetical protein
MTPSKNGRTIGDIARPNFILIDRVEVLVEQVISDRITVFAFRRNPVCNTLPNFQI